ncbi:MAG TPA: YcaO-like family protein, partial [Ktedonobacteraceae bacterium]|nr:YcaO-like family protein [Ktedonobacteraceae bacterium]
KACECYAAHCVNQQRLLPSESLQCAQTWALDLQTQEAVRVPADHVFAAQGEQARGIAAGQTWEEALCQALLDWCNYLTIEHVQKAEQAYPQIDLERVPLSPEGAHLYRLLQAAGEQVAVYDVTGPLCVPTFATCSGGKIIAYSTHYDSAQALTLGLEQALQGYQSTQFQQPDYALAPVQDFPAHLRSTQLSIPGYTLPNAWPARLEWLLKQLQASGLRAFVIPLDHDPALTRVFPLIIRVFVGGSEWEKGE